MFMFYVFALFLSLINFGHVYTAPANTASSATIQCLNEYKNNQSTIGNTKLVESATAVINSYKETSILNLNSILLLIPRSDIQCIMFCIQKQSGAVDESVHKVDEIFYSFLNVSTEMKPKFDECYQRIQSVSTIPCEKSMGIELCAFSPTYVLGLLNDGMKLSEAINEAFDHMAVPSTPDSDNTKIRKYVA